MSGAEIYSIIITTLMGIIGFFVKKAFSDIASKADKSELEKLQHTVTGIKDDYLTREDFFREQLKTEKKLDKIMDILMEMKGGANHE
ncbi:MAG: hypothetical protein IJ446_09035 [Oscillospiraceae bacterium]|nr:hypothetical protein [Oscillospiraceae bacterium]